jgi:hypothetical protein
MKNQQDSREKCTPLPQVKACNVRNCFRLTRAHKKTAGIFSAGGFENGLIQLGLFLEIAGLFQSGLSDISSDQTFSTLSPKRQQIFFPKQCVHTEGFLR